MNENARAWVAALRSGKFPQARYGLHTRDGYCCLGVGCELAVRAGVPINVEVLEHGIITTYDGRREYLPQKVQEWLGLRTDNGAFRDRHDAFPQTLSRLNDNDRPFAEIADTIESEPPGLFKEDA